MNLREHKTKLKLIVMYHKKKFVSTLVTYLEYVSHSAS